MFPVSVTYYFSLLTDRGRLQARLVMGLTEKTAIVGEGLGDDLWHSVVFKRRGMTITLGVDDDPPLLGNYACLCLCPPILGTWTIRLCIIARSLSLTLLYSRDQRQRELPRLQPSLPGLDLAQ